jgi:DNA modification methylase
MATPYYDHAGITIYHGDCLEILPTLGKVDAVVTDPPYGMAWDTADLFRKGHNRKRRRPGRNYDKPVRGDRRPFDPSPWLDIGKRQILFGANHYAARLPVGTTLVWIKRLDAAFGSFLSDAEIAWMSGGHGVYCFRDLSMNAETASRSHPTQKPLPLMRWCLQKTEGLVLDPYMGSGSTLRAAKDLGRKAIGIEIEERYCEIAAKRLAQEVLPLEVANG